MSPKLTKAQRRELRDKYYYVPRVYATYAKQIEHPVVEGRKAWFVGEVPIGTKVTVKLPFSGMQGNRQIFHRKLQVTVTKAPNGQWELTHPKPLKDSTGSSWLITPIKIGGTNGKTALFKAAISMGIYLNSLRIFTFLERAVRGGNKTLAYKEDWSQWEYLLECLGADPDQMEVNALNWLIHLAENPYTKHALPDFDYRKV